jgi:hypothetical protein
MLELVREGVERQRGAERRPTLLNALNARQREKRRGVGLVPHGARIGAEREGPGCGTV